MCLAANDPRRGTTVNGMPEEHYLALLRGINVGGKNVIKMTDLKACFEEMGFAEVATYIQSGNVLFAASVKGEAKLSATIEKALSKRFGYESRVIVVSHEQLERAVKRAPKGFGREPGKYRYDVIFLREPMSASEAMKSVSTKDGVDQAWKGDGVLYFSRLIERATQSHLSRIVGLPVYQEMTIRNWNTTTKLLALMEARAKGG
jgi:uncharacterized protein (DUF1697 family)